MSSYQCCHPGCRKAAASGLRVLPRKTVTPLCGCIRRALCWPGQAEPVTLWVCADKAHRKAIRDAAHVVLSATVLEAEVSA